MDDDLKSRIEAHLPTLRKCDTQPTAVKWMVAAYNLLEECLKAEPPPSALILPERPRLIVVQSIPTSPPTFLAHRADPKIWLNGQTVVYPSQPDPIRPPPRAWTREDTLRLERAAQKRQRPLIQRLGK